MSWSPFDGGATIGTKGSETGLIERDEEHSEGSRISLERGGYALFFITCGVYGTFVHTAFASSEGEATEKYGAMKAALEALLSETNQQRLELLIRDFVERY